MSLCWRLVQLCLAVLALSIVTSCTESRPTDADSRGCIKSFHQFAYEGPGQRPQDEPIVIPPSPSWQMQSVPRLLHDIERSYALNSIELSRIVDGHDEIWIRLSDSTATNYQLQLYEDLIGFGVYSPDLRRFDYVPRTIEDTRLNVGRLYVDSTGKIWGETDWRNIASSNGITEIPLLIRFDEQSGRFKFTEDALRIPLTQAADLGKYTRIIIDKQDVFWFFAEDGVIYRYAPVTDRSLVAITKSGGIVTDLSLAPNDNFYFALEDLNSDQVYISQYTLMRFSPRSGQITIIDVPDLDWPNYSGLLVDRDGRVWLGAIAYREPDGTWRLFYPPYLQTFQHHRGQYLWSTPRILFESSDGKLWFSKTLDAGLWGAGTAWVDPISEHGCLVTNVATNVIEDSSGHIWIAVGGVLYEYGSDA